MKDEAAISAIKVQGDERSGLTWKGLFMDVDNTVNFYSTRDEVVANGDGRWKWPLAGWKFSEYYHKTDVVGHLQGEVVYAGATRHLCSAKRRCIVYVVMFCASRDHESWQGVASLRDATRKGVEQLTRKSFSTHFSRALPILLILCDSCECPSTQAQTHIRQYMRYAQMRALCCILA